MNYLDIGWSPDLLEESRQELERELERKRRVREALAARQVERPSRFAALAARLRALRSDPRRPIVEGC